MIKKLRKKFIFIAMVSVIVVMGGIIAVINIVNYSRVMKDSEGVIKILAENDGRFPSPFPLPPDGDHLMTYETPFSSRFFSVDVNDQGMVTDVDVEKIAEIDEKRALRYASQLFKEGKRDGVIDNYQFLAKETEEGLKYIFLDVGKDLKMVRNFLTLSLTIGAGSLFLVFVLVFFLSKLALKPAEESSERQKSFITNVSHDIKTPLAVIGAQTEVIELENGESLWTEEIKKQVSRLNALTERLVFLSKMEEESFVLNLSDFNLKETAEELLSNYSPLAERRGVRIKNLIPNQSFFCRADESLTVQALALVFDNALKYCLKGGEIEVLMGYSSKFVEITVKNPCENVKKGKLNEVFERFYRAESSRGSEGGHGIGLSVVKTIVDTLKGKVYAQSTDGKSFEIVTLFPRSGKKTN